MDDVIASGSFWRMIGPDIHEGANDRCHAVEFELDFIRIQLNSASSPLQFLTYLHRDSGSLNLFSYSHLNMSSFSLLTSVISPF